MALRQQPDHVVVPRLANVRARPITLFQLLNAEMIRHVRHARPLRFIAHQANCFAPPRESADSISRKPYNARGAKGAGYRHLARVNRQREEPDVQWKAAAFVRWHEPDDARVSSPVL